MSRNFRELLEAKWEEGKFICVGLDSDWSKIPECITLQMHGSHDPTYHAIRSFNEAIVDATRELVCAYKPNIAFYESHSESGLRALRETIKYIHKVAPDVPVILDAKRADIDNTNLGYVHSAFDELKADAVTVHPYLGAQALKPFLDQKDKGIIVLCRTSNKGAGEFQDLPVETNLVPPMELMPLYQCVAMRVAKEWDWNGNCAVVVGATYPEELKIVRGIVGDMPILIPGIGAQGGDLEKTVHAGKNSRGRGMIINSSRGIIFASNGEDFAEAARCSALKLHEQIQKCLEVQS